MRGVDAEEEIRSLLRAGRHREAREAAIARVRGMPGDDAAVALLLEVERRAVEAERRQRADEGDETFSGMFGQSIDRRRLRGRIQLVAGVVLLMVAGWWLVNGVRVGPRGTFPMRMKSGATRDVGRTEAFRTAALIAGVSLFGFAGYWLSRRRDEAG
ncbi:MAG: hypothetical protein ACKO5K_02215 [Armatimonadota bacterium]